MGQVGSRSGASELVVEQVGRVGEPVLGRIDCNPYTTMDESPGDTNKLLTIL